MPILCGDPTGDFRQMGADCSNNRVGLEIESPAGVAVDCFLVWGYRFRRSRDGAGGAGMAWFGYPAAGLVGGDGREKRRFGATVLGGLQCVWGLMIICQGLNILLFWWLRAKHKNLLIFRTLRDACSSLD
jgi:hypothetical protein